MLPTPDNSVCFVLFRHVYLGNTLRYVAIVDLTTSSRGDVFWSVFCTFFIIGYKTCFNVVFILTPMFFTTMIIISYSSLNFMLPLSMVGGGYYVLTVPLSQCPVPISALFSLRMKTLNGFQFGEVVITTKRWTDYVLRETVRGTREHDTTENSNRRQTGVTTQRMTS